MSDVKMVVVVREGAANGSSKGYIASQACHAAISALMHSLYKEEEYSWTLDDDLHVQMDANSILNSWFNEKQTIVTLKAADDVFYRIFNDANRLDFPISTLVEDGTEAICFAIGPIKSKNVDVLTEDLPLLK